MDGRRQALQVGAVLTCLSVMTPGAWAGGADEARLCVKNADTQAHFFAVEAEGAARRSGALAPGEVLCTRGEAGKSGVVWVFESEASVEGCSRLVAVGKTEAMLRYSEFDRCAWSSNTEG